MEYRVLGPLEVLDESGQKVSVGGAMQQRVLASHLLRAGQTVALDRLIDELWDEPPATAGRTVQAYVSLFGASYRMARSRCAPAVTRSSFEATSWT